MKLTSACVVVITGASAWAQLANPAKIINGVRNQAHSAAAHEKAVQQPHSAGTPSTASRKKAEQAQPAKTEAKAQPKATSQANSGTIQMTGKRDPFVSVIRSEPARSGGCATGKKCLVVGDIALKGVVRSEEGMIAVVENGQRKTYFLHENDPVFNGQVVKIEPDAIVFRETVVDRAGRQSAREVVKRISKPSIS